MTKKIKVLTISDHPLSPSGVGSQTKYICEALLKSGNFTIVSIGGAIKHENYQPATVSPYDNDWVVIPVDGYGNAESIRSIIRTQKPDILWFMTDPRFWGWLWQIENEIAWVSVASTTNLPSSIDRTAFFPGTSPSSFNLGLVG